MRWSEWVVLYTNRNINENELRKYKLFPVCYVESMKLINLITGVVSGSAKKAFR